MTFFHSASSCRRRIHSSKSPRWMSSPETASMARMSRKFRFGHGRKFARPPAPPAPPSSWRAASTATPPSYRAPSSKAPRPVPIGVQASCSVESRTVRDSFARLHAWPNFAPKNSSQQALCFRQCLVQFAGVFAAAARVIRPAPALAADDGRNLLNDFARLNSLRELG